MKIRKQLKDNIAKLDDVVDTSINGDNTIKVDGNRLDYDETRITLRGEFESLRGGHDDELNAYNSCYAKYAMMRTGDERIGLSQTITPIIYEKVEWIASTMNKILTESNDALKVDPTSPENIFSSRAAQELIDDSLRNGAESHTVITDIIRGAFIGGNAYVKCGWQSGDKYDPVGRFVFEAVPNERMFWDHDYGTFDNSPCVYDSTMVSLSDIILAAESDNDWFIDRLKDAIESGGSETGEDKISSEATRHNVSSSQQSAGVEKPTASRSEFEVVEGWTQYDIDGDGVVTDVMVVFVNNELVRMVKSNMPDGKHPYLCFQGKRDPYQALGWTMERILGHSQNNATMIDRMIINNISAQDNGIMMYNERNVSPLAAAMHKRGLPRTMLPVSDITNAIAPVASVPLAPYVPQYKAEILNASDGLSGFTKSTNLDIQMLKGTANNGNIVNNSGQTRIWEDTKRFLETVLKPLGMKRIAYSSQWMTPEDFKYRFGIDLSKAEIKELFKTPRYKVTVDISLPSDNSEKLQQIMSWAQYFMPMAQPGPDGQMSPSGQKISEAGDKMAIEAAKLMGLTNFERDLNGGEYIGTNGLLIEQKDLDAFRASLPGSDGGGMEELFPGAEGGFGAEEPPIGEEVPMEGMPEGIEGGGGLDGLEGLLGAGENPEGDLGGMQGL